MAKREARKSRLPQFELLRIISMLLIVTLHFMSHGGVNDRLELGSVAYFVFSFIRMLSYLGVNCFVLLSGYFLCESSFKPSRIIKTIMQVLFYSVLCALLSFVVFHTKLGIKDLLFTFFPISGNKYWFASVYIVMLFISPVLNYAISRMDRKQHIGVVIILLFAFSIIPTLLFWGKGTYSDGKDVGWFITLYMMAAFVRKHPMELRKNYVRLLFLGCILLTVIIEFGIHAIALSFSIAIPEKFMYYNNSPFIALGSILLLIWVSKMKRIPALKAVTIIGSLTFGVYLLHDNDLIRNKLWGIIDAPRYLDNLAFEALYMIGVVIVIFIVGCVIELIRKKIMSVLRIEEILGEITDRTFDKAVFRIEGKIKSEE